jgi:hypothetical protein
MFFIKSAGVANKLSHFTPLIFSSGHPQYVFTFIPECNFSGTFIAIPMCIDRFSKPNSAFETEGLRSEHHRANIDHVAGKSCQSLPEYS